MRKIRNDLKAIYSQAIASVNPALAVKNTLKLKNNKLILFSNERSLKEFNLTNYKRIIVIGAGKATASMAKAVEEIFYDRIWGGIIIVKYDYTEKLKIIETIEASHPIPDANGLAGAKRIREILSGTDEKDLIISLISGGGSSLMPLPPERISLEEKRSTTDLLLKSGATIHEINSVRKHISLVKGGNLASAAYPSTVINLMISDVVGDNMDVIASGPFVPDNSTFARAKEILNKYGLTGALPINVLNHLDSGVRGEIDENPKPGSHNFKGVNNLIIASNIIALKTAKKEAEKRGYNTIVLSSLIEGDTKNASQIHSEIAKEILLSSNPVPAPACIISGGETTVAVKGSGLGGRNMEFAIHGALFIDGYNNILMSSIGTDGTDGPTDAAGAIADGTTIERSKKKGINVYEYIQNNDSYNFFKELGDLIITGPTNTNVMDVRIVIVKN